MNTISVLKSRQVISGTGCFQHKESPVTSQTSQANRLWGCLFEEFQSLTQPPTNLLKPPLPARQNKSKEQDKGYTKDLWNHQGDNILDLSSSVRGTEWSVGRWYVGVKLWMQDVTEATQRQAPASPPPPHTHHERNEAWELHKPQAPDSWFGLVGVTTREPT